MCGLKAATGGGVLPAPAPSVPPAAPAAGTGGRGGVSGDECARIAKPTPAPKRCALPRHGWAGYCHAAAAATAVTWRDAPTSAQTARAPISHVPAR